MTTWGILGCGNIARSFARDLRRVPGARLAAVGSRDPAKAAAFAREHGAERAHGSYRELAADPGVEAVYIATPHPSHHRDGLLCLAHGKPVLIEKPLALDARQGGELVAEARRRGLALMEAMWTRFLPTMAAVRRWVRQGAVGRPGLLVADFSFAAAYDPASRLYARELGGGALLDVGVYCLALAQDLLGGDPVRLQASARLAPTGADACTALAACYPQDAQASLTCAIDTAGEHRALLVGSEGRIEMPAFWRSERVRLLRRGTVVDEVRGESGYHFEAAAFQELLASGAIEHPLMSHAGSLGVLAALDRARQQVGVRYPACDG